MSCVRSWRSVFFCGNTMGKWGPPLKRRPTWTYCSQWTTSSQSMKERKQESRRTWSQYLWTRYRWGERRRRWRFSIKRRDFCGIVRKSWFSKWAIRTLWIWRVAGSCFWKFWKSKPDSTRWRMKSLRTNRRWSNKKKPRPLKQTKLWKTRSSWIRHTTTMSL